jgi:hypothetical protein
MKTWKVHPAALAFPRMSVAEFNELKADIAAKGMRLPILVNKKKDTILDGRNRMMVAHDLKLEDGEVPIEVFTGTSEEEVSEIISRNIHRRHLTDDQRVAIVAKLRGPQLTKEAQYKLFRSPSAVWIVLSENLTARRKYLEDFTGRHMSIASAEVSALACHTEAK